MLGEKYGARELPSSLPFETFQSLRHAIKESSKTTDEALDFIDAWYKKDSNSEPTVYVLQPIHEVLSENSLMRIV